ncbi:transposase [Archaeoglobus sulfaticallidus]|uniref:transposase n=1 Tax=Archaeoglobus sulfaticallidus TaxID=1316941 RepID=UPI000693544C|nr:transposase [Archaeoglobus sulfaticallidus]
MKEEYGFDKKYLWIDTGIDLTQYDVRNIQITPLKYSGRIFYQMGIIYSVEQEQTQQPEKERLMSIDFNTSNFAVIVIEDHPTSYIIDGRGLMSLLRKYLKKISRLQSRRDNLKEGLPHHKLNERIAKLWKRVRNLLRDFSHRVSNLIVELARRQVTRIIVGNVHSSKNKESKLPDLVNQMFSLLPHGKVVRHLKYKFGDVVEVSEEYTSGVDSVKYEYPSREYYEPRKRVKRFKSVIGIINADVNSARNILKKYLYEIGQTDHVLKDMASGLKQIIRLRVFHRLRGSSESAVLGQIGVVRGCVPLGVVRGLAQTHPETPCVSEG